MMRSFGAPADWQTDLPDAMFARISKSLVINKALLSKSEWRSRDETLLAFAGREDALTIGRLPALRLREILGSPFKDDDAGRQ